MKKSTKINIVLELTEPQWSELYHAIESKVAYVSRGDYGDGPDDQKWEKELLVIQKYLARLFKKINLTY